MTGRGPTWSGVFLTSSVRIPRVTGVTRRVLVVNVVPATRPRGARARRLAFDVDLNPRRVAGRRHVTDRSCANRNDCTRVPSTQLPRPSNRQGQACTPAARTGESRNAARRRVFELLLVLRRSRVLFWLLRFRVILRSDLRDSTRQSRTRRVFLTRQFA